jgi:hypothetical protein
LKTWVDGPIVQDVDAASRIETVTQIAIRDRNWKGRKIVTFQLVQK